MSMRLTITDGVFGGDEIEVEVTVEAGLLSAGSGGRYVVTAALVGEEKAKIVEVEFDAGKFGEGLTKTATKKYGEGVAKMLTSVKLSKTQRRRNVCRVSATPVSLRLVDGGGGLARLRVPTPAQLTPSFALAYMQDRASVRYRVHAVLWAAADKRRLGECCAPVRVLGYDGAAPQPRAHLVSSAHKLRTSFLSKDRVRLQVSSRQVAFTGAALPLSLAVDNDSGQCIEHVHVLLRSSLVVRIGERVSTSVTERSLLNATVAVPPRASHTVDLLLDLPGPSQLAASVHSHHTQLSHHLVVAVVDSAFVASKTECCLPLALFHQRRTAPAPRRCSKSPATRQLSLADGALYEGAVDSSGQAVSGRATLTYASGDRFVGVFTVAKAGDAPAPLDGDYYYAAEPSSFEDVDPASFADSGADQRSTPADLGALGQSASFSSPPGLLDALLGQLPRYRAVWQSPALQVDFDAPAVTRRVASVAELHTNAALFCALLTGQAPPGDAAQLLLCVDAAALLGDSAALLAAVQQPSVLLYLVAGPGTPVQQLADWLVAVDAPPHPFALLLRAACLTRRGVDDAALQQLAVLIDDSRPRCTPLQQRLVDVVWSLLRVQHARGNRDGSRTADADAAAERLLAELSEQHTAADCQAAAVALQLLFAASLLPYLRSLQSVERYSATGSYAATAALLTARLAAAADQFATLQRRAPAALQPQLHADLHRVVALVCAADAPPPEPLLASPPVSLALASDAMSALLLCCNALGNAAYRPPTLAAASVPPLFAAAVRLGKAAVDNGAVASAAHFFVSAVHLVREHDPSPRKDLLLAVAQILYQLIDECPHSQQSAGPALLLASVHLQRGQIHDMLVLCEKAILSVIDQPSSISSTLSTSFDSTASTSTTSTFDSTASTSTTSTTLDSTASTSSAPTSFDSTTLDSTASTSSATMSFETTDSTLSLDELQEPSADSADSVQTTVAVCADSSRVSVAEAHVFGYLATATKLVCFKAPTSVRTRRLCEQMLSFIRHSSTPDAPASVALTVLLLEKLCLVAMTAKERSTAVSYARAAVAHYESNERLLTGAQLRGSGLLPGQSYCLALLHLSRLCYAVGCTAEALTVARQLPALFEAHARSTGARTTERRTALKNWSTAEEWCRSLAAKSLKTLLGWQKAKTNPAGVYLAVYSACAPAGGGGGEQDVQLAHFALQRALNDYNYAARKKQLTVDTELSVDDDAALLNNKQPSSSSQATSNQSSQSTSSPSGQLTTVVKWVADSEATHCWCCRAEFGLFRRKHHCRACGQVVCDNCSPSKQLAPHPSPVRVCKKCSP